MLESGSVLQERYELKQQLSDNPARQTWLAEDKKSGERVVVKLLTFGAHLQWDDLKLFEREAEVLQRLSHPQIPKYRDYFSLDDRFTWFGSVHEYIPGASLKQMLDEKHQFTEEQARQIAKDVLEILIYLHALTPPVLHRDIKPSNLILGADDKIYLVDFGAVQNQAAAAGATFTVVGTYGYTPIEQYGGQAVEASDLYALGATLIHLLAGTPPADLPSRDLRVQFRDRLRSPVSLTFLSWIEHLTQPALERRFSSAERALKALDAGQLVEGEISTLGAPPETRVTFNQSPQQLEIEIPARVEIELLEPSKKFVNRAVEAVKGSVAKAIARVKESEIFTRGPFWWRVGAVGVASAVLGLCLPVIIYIVGMASLLAVGLGVCSLFILAGNWLARRRSYFERTYVCFDWNNFSLELQQIGLLNYRRQKGVTAEIQEVSVAPYYDPKSPKNSPPQLGVVVTTGIFQGQVEKYAFGQELSEAELVWLAQEIREWLGNRPR